MSIKSLGQYLSVIGAPRCFGKVKRRLIKVLVAAVCAVIACAESWDDIAPYGRSELVWLRTFRADTPKTLARVVGSLSAC